MHHINLDREYDFSEPAPQESAFDGSGQMVEPNFEGLFFNRIPAIRRLKWRFLVTGKVLAGSVSSANKSLTPTTNEQG